jgi:microcystin degradation protein MlrC
MRVAIAGLALESVSFLPVETEIADFERSALRGCGLIEGLRGTASVGGGFIAVLEEASAEIVPLLYTDCLAAGPAADAAFEAYRDEIVAGLAAEAGRLDGVLLYLHGAMTTPTHTNPDLEMAMAVRRTVGPDLPLMLALDLHGNLSPALANHCTALFGFHYSPHTDMAGTGARAARCLLGALRGDVAPRLALAKAPIVLPSIFTATDLAPLSDIVAAGFALEAAHGAVIDVSVFCGFAYADVPDIGFTVAVVTDGDCGLGARLAGDLATRVWERCHDLMRADRVHDLAGGVRHALDLAATATHPVVLLEHADRMNDSTWGLGELLRQGAVRAMVPYLWDPAAAAAAVAAGQGASVRVAAGGHSSDRAGAPVTVEGTVCYAGRKVYIGTGPMRRDRRIDLGATALIDTGGVLVSLTSNPVAAIDADPFVQFGLDPGDFDIILLRSKTHFRTIYGDIAEAIVIIDTHDWGPADLTTLPYRNVPAGVFPITVV